MVFSEIKNYKYEITTRDGQCARLDLFDENNKMMARAIFIKDPLPMPKNQSHPKYSSIYFRLSALPAIIDMLRNEKPVYYMWEEVTKRGHTTTAKEPVGEGEHTTG